MPTFAQLQQTITQQNQVLAAFQPVLQASLDLTGVAVAKLEELFLLVKGLQGQTPTQEQIDELATSVAAAKDTITGDIESVNTRNAAMQAELEKINAPPTTGG